MNAPVERPSRPRRTALVAAVLTTVGLLVAALFTPITASAAPAAAPGASVSAASTCKAPALPYASKPYPRFYRPNTWIGQKDENPKVIHHVREAQYRLMWLRHFKAKVSGYYGWETREAVKAFQQKSCLKVTGHLDRASWAHLIQRTTNLDRIPKACKASGWQLCYDRTKHQSYLFLNGSLWNVWLVRGGSKSMATRTGTYNVFARYPYKVSTIYNVPLWNFLKHSGGQGHHGSGFMMDPFVGHSHGCINMYIIDSKVLYAMVKDKKVRVTVFGNWH